VSVSLHTNFAAAAYLVEGIFFFLFAAKIRLKFLELEVGTLILSSREVKNLDPKKLI
jgi:hypothetical protein